ncbi:DUF2946 family protein [Azospirillum griseum]|uniref:DUF2946 family protein n=1 Tax=Azospirillum griseum TaxID=2496639 RepID=UPI0013156CD1|nr:DUF2946 family protein [Azospirillum griseum]
MSLFRRLALGCRRVSLMVGALAFLCQALAWSVMMPAQAMAASNSTVADVITICSVDGIKTIKVGPDGQALPDEDGTAAASGHCPLCPLLAGAGLPPVPPLALPTEQVAAHDARALPGDAIAAGWFLSSLQARAPPSVG